VNKSGLRVGCIDAERPSGWLAEQVGEQAGFEVTTVATPSGLLEAATAGDIDGAVVGRLLPGPGDRDGPALVGTLREQAPDLPVVLCTEVGDEETAARAVGADATAYVRRGETDAFDRVGSALRKAAETDRANAAADADGADAATDDAPGSGVADALLRAATENETLSGRLEALLGVGCERFGLRLGFLAHVDDRLQIIAAQGGHDAIKPGASAPVEETYCERLLGSGTSLALSDVAAAWGEDDERLQKWGLRCYLGTEVRVHGRSYGTLCFADTSAREEPFSESERTLLDLLGQWVGYELARRDRIDRLEQRTTRLDEFSGIVTHDLRNPLAVAAGHLSLARDGAASDVQTDAESQPERHFERAGTALDRMEEVIDRALRLSEKGRTLERRPIELSTLATRAWRRADTGTASLAGTRDRTVDADPGLAVELLRELFTNAVANGDAEEVRVAGTDEGFVVADDGSGIPKGEHGLLFDRGSSDGAGAGLGLHVVACIADAHDWTLRAGDPDPDRGARFEVRTKPAATAWPPGVGGDRSSVDGPATVERAMARGSADDD
jgi:signal transduction histidine kinase/CheY-like chemotaxis protein